MRNAIAGYVLRAPLIVLVSSYTAWAQTAATAQINGSVRDQAGLALPGVTVTVTQTDTGLTRTGITDETGSYVLQNLPVGRFRFEAALQRFRTYVQTGISRTTALSDRVALTLTSV
jgi:hypothetical protein